MAGTKAKSGFRVGDSVVYPLQGVGFIRAKESRNAKEYYRIQILSSEMDVLLPVETALSLGLRHLATQDEAKKAISSLSVRREMSRMDWKSRLLMNQELMKEGSLLLMASDEPERIAKAFGKELAGEPLWLDGVLSRKKQVVPNLEAAFKA